MWALLLFAQFLLDTYLFKNICCLVVDLIFYIARSALNHGVPFETIVVCSFLALHRRKKMLM